MIQKGKGVWAEKVWMASGYLCLKACLGLFLSLSMIGVGILAEGETMPPFPRTIVKLVPASPPVRTKAPQPKSTALPENALQEPEQADIYGVVLAIKDKGAPPAGSLAKPIKSSAEVLQKVTIRLDGRALHLKGITQRVITVDNILGENPAYNIPLKPGARVLLNMEKNPGTGKWTFYVVNRDRTPALMILGTLFIMAVLIIGGPEVAKHALLLILMLTGCYKALFPAVLSENTGANWILLMCFMFTVLASFIYKKPGTRSFNREQTVVVLGTMGGLIMLTLILCLMHTIAPLDGFSTEGLASIWYRAPQMDYWMFYLAGVLIAFQGLLFYLCWSLAQNRKEQNGQALNFVQRFQMIMQRGRRLLGPMLSSVGLLFLGLLAPVLLQLQGTPTAQFINLESTASILTLAFAGGLTMILTVPLTALIAACLLTKPPEIADPAATQTE